jgi:hypothetical protein
VNSWSGMDAIYIIANKYRWLLKRRQVITWVKRAGIALIAGVLRVIHLLLYNDTDDDTDNNENNQGKEEAYPTFLASSTR